jgi:SAM-dependent methyltransferase/uncharacterized protein YbaR (Trm112 family)
MEWKRVNKDKIYEDLETVSRPAGYKERLPWAVQQQIAATNGNHFRASVGRLTEYPIPPLPIRAIAAPGLFLDIGCGWGRWLVAAARKNYLPIGIDIRLGFCEVSQAVLRDNGLTGYTAVADLRSLPFQGNCFDVVWSFSVIQHTHFDRLIGCIKDISRILKDGKSYCYLEFPNKNGIRNRFGPARTSPETVNDYDSWDVRYYTTREYRAIFGRFFDNFQYYNHSSLGIGILPGDIKYVNGFKNKTVVMLSRVLSRVFEVLTPLKAYSDSIYIKCHKNADVTDAQETGLNRFWEMHRVNPGNNMNIIHLLRCPATGGQLTLSEGGTEIISEKARLAYPIKTNIPIMIPSEARSL